MDMGHFKYGRQTHNENLPQLTKQAMEDESVETDDASTEDLFLTPTQARLLSGLPKSEGDKAVDGRSFSKALADVLKSGIVVMNTRKGKVVTLDAAHLLAIKKVGFDLKHPDNIDLLQYSKALGEQQNSSLDVNITIKPSQAFEGTEAKVVRHDVVAEEDSK